MVNMPHIMKFSAISLDHCTQSSSAVKMPKRLTSNRQRRGTSLFTQMSKNKWFLTFILLGLFVAATNAVDEKKSAETKTAQPSLASPASTLSSRIVNHRDEIYIDDESIEGSGGRGELHDDLEKDPDYSGSGFGPDDDEDTSTDHHHSRRPSVHSPSGNSKYNTNNNNDLITSRTNSGTILGSGTNSGNSGIISGTDSNTGLNTIGKDHTSTSSSSTSTTRTTTTNSSPQPTLQSSSSATSSTPKTSTTTLTDNHQHPQHTTTTTTSSSFNPIHTYSSPSSPKSPQSADDDFDLDETIDGDDGLIAGSGDGSALDNDDEDDDIDTDDDSYDGRHYQHNLGATSHIGGNASNTDHKFDGDFFDSTLHHRPEITEEKHEDKHDDSLGSNVDDFDEDDVAGNYDDNDEDVDSDDDSTEIYTDVTDPSRSGGDSSSGGPVHKQPGINTHAGNVHELDSNNINSLPPETKIVEHTTGNEVLIMNAGDDDRTTSFFAQPGILAAVIGGAVVGLLCAILVVMFIVYRMRKKDEGSYALDEPKRSPAVNSYAKNANNREFYA